jgi:hypothetical protein
VIKEIKKAVFDEDLPKDTDLSDCTIRNRLKDAAKAFPNAKARIPNRVV